MRISDWSSDVCSSYLRAESRKRLKAYVILLAVTVTILVGLSRVYLGVHWPTDVLGGWMVGSAWAAVCWTLAMALQRGGRLEEESAGSDPPDSASEDA